MSMDFINKKGDSDNSDLIPSLEEKISYIINSSIIEEGPQYLFNRT